MDENENRNETAAILFSIFTGLAILLLAAWFTAGGKRSKTPEVATSLSVGPGDPSEVGNPAVPVASEEPRQLDAPTALSSVEPSRNASSKLSPEAKANLDAKRNVLAEQKKSVNPEIEKLKNERDAYKINAESARDQLTGMAELEIRVAKLDAGLKVAASSKSELQNKLDEMATARNELAAQLETKTKEADKAQEANLSKIKGLDDQVVALKLELEAIKKAMASEADTLQKNLAQARTEVTQHKSKITEMEKLNLGLNQSLTEFKAQKGQFEAKIAELGKEKAELTKTIATLKEDTHKKMAGVKEGEANLIKLTEERDQLKDQWSKMDAVSAKMSGDFTGRIKSLEQENQSLTSHIAKMTAGGATMIAINAELNQMKEANKKLSEEVAKAKTAAEMAKTNASGQINKLSAEIENLKSQLSSVRNAPKLNAAFSGPVLELPLLVNDPAKLDSRLLPLFTELRSIPDNLEAKSNAYTEIEKRGKAEPVMQINFTSGSSEVSDLDRPVLRKLGEESPGSKFLIIGYASVDGDAPSNYELASKRASRVAQEIVGDKKTVDQVQAVYFGQTQRFSKAYNAPNRVVEIWKVDE